MNFSHWTNRADRKMRSLLIASMLAAVTLLSPSVERNGLYAQALGLTELLPQEKPVGISEDDFSVLPETWKEWAGETLQLLDKIYGSESLPLAGQKETLEKLQVQIDIIDDALSDSAYAASYDELANLRGKLQRRVALLQAVLVTLDENPKQQQALRPALHKLLQAIEGYEADSKLGNSDSLVRQQMDAILAITNDNAEALQEAIRIHYFNFNIRVFVSEPFAESVFHECRRECGPVCDFILGARVRGTQHTRSGVSIDFLPGEEAARFAIQVSGNTTSRTTGVTSQATIYTYGRHRFCGKKVLLFDGESFSSYRASLSVWANNHVTGAHLNRRGLLAKLIGDKIAYQRAVDSKPESEAIAAQRLRSRVLPKFNREVDNTFGELNEELKKLEERMNKEKIAPDQKLVRTYTDELRTGYRLMNSGQLAADRPATAFNSKTGITLHIHESWINNALAIEGYQFEKAEMSFPDFGEQLAEKFRRAFNSDREIKKAKDNGDRVIIADVDPVHVQFDDGKIKVIMRVGLKPNGRDKIIKLRRVEVPIKIDVADDSIVLSISEDDKVRVLPLDSSDRSPISNRIIGSKIRAQFEERLAEKALERTFDFPVDEHGEKRVPVIIDSLHAVNGWLVIVIEEKQQSEEE